MASQVDIDKEKSCFNYNGFSMVPGIREVFEDDDQSFYLSTDKGEFFVKINKLSDLSRFEYEKESMLAINEAVPDFAPHPFCLGNLPKGGKFLVVNCLEWTWEAHTTIESHINLAKKLAQLHQKKSPNGKFGFHSYKNNQWKDNWATFFYENRWWPFWERFLQKYSHDEEMKKWGKIIGEKVIPDLLGNLQIEPVLLHGNLDFDSFSANSQTKQPWVFDTHSYFGHNEMDLSLLGCRSFYLGDEMHMSKFLAEYQKYNPLQPGFEKRKLLYQLYHYLHRRLGWTKITPGEKFHKKCLNMMKKLGQRYNQI